MPHLVVECSPSVRELGRKALSTLAPCFCGLATVEPRAVKARLMVADDHVMGEGAGEDFLHVEVRILAGRSPETLAEIADALGSELRRTLGASPGLNLTLELREMSAATYRKP